MLSSKTSKKKFMVKGFEEFGLSAREKEVMALLLEKRSNRETGKKLFISITTVKTHVHRIPGKSEVRIRTELVKKIEDINIL